MQKPMYVLSMPDVLRQRWILVCATLAMLVFASPGHAEAEASRNVVRFATTATQELTQGVTPSQYWENVYGVL